jgi:hypothetical protein
MNKPQKFTYISRVIDPKTRVHYLDALDENGRWWRAEMKQEEEDWITYTKHWTMM